MFKAKDHPYHFKFDDTAVLNEAWYIATLAMNDSNPELDVRKWWWRAKDNTGGSYGSNLVMSMVYAILSLQEKQTERIEKIIKIMRTEDYQKQFPPFQELVEHCNHRYQSVFSLAGKGEKAAIPSQRKTQTDISLKAIVEWSKKNLDNMSDVRLIKDMIAGTTKNLSEKEAALVDSIADEFNHRKGNITNNFNAPIGQHIDHVDNIENKQ